MSSSAVSVWIDDRHPIFRRGLVASLRAEAFTVAGESGSFEPAPPLDAVDVLIFEAEDGGLREALRSVNGSRVRLVALIRDVDETLILEAVQAGVSAVLLRSDLSPAVLASTLRAAAAGHTTLPTALVPGLLSSASADDGTPGIRQLTNRELKVLRLLAAGEDTRGIAEKLSYSDRTVKNIVHDLLMKMNCRNRAHAVAQAARHGLI